MIETTTETTLTETTQIFPTERLLVNHVPTLLEKKNLTPNAFKAMVILAGLSFDTADRLLAGETNFSMKTLALVANHLGVDIADIIALEDTL